MFIDFLNKLKNSKIPVSINEFLTFLEALNLNLVQYDIDKFYYLARTSLIKMKNYLINLIFYFLNILNP